MCEWVARVCYLIKAFGGNGWVEVPEVVVKYTVHVHPAKGITRCTFSSVKNKTTTTTKKKEKKMQNPGVLTERNKFNQSRCHAVPFSFRLF